MIYMDHAATTPMRPEALEVMKKSLSEDYFNASASYQNAQQVKGKLDLAREKLSKSIGAGWGEVFFTSGGTESDNWALVGAAEAYADKGRHIVVSSVEHHAILHTCDYLKTRGYEITYLPVDNNGMVSEEDLEDILNRRKDTILVSVMWANNEVGTIEPIEALSACAHRHGCLFHTDAVQAYGKIPIDVSVGIDLLSVSAHKIGGPKGVGFLYIKRGVTIGAILRGGSQESGRRAGTENTSAIFGFAAAAEAAMLQMNQEQEREKTLQTYFYKTLQDCFQEGEEFIWNGPIPGPNRLYSNVSISFPKLETATLLINLDMAGICASGGSACTTGALDPSHVIMAMTKDAKIAGGTLRFTLGPDNTEAEIDEVVRVLKKTKERMERIAGNV